MEMNVLKGNILDHENDYFHLRFSFAKKTFN